MNPQSGIVFAILIGFLSGVLLTLLGTLLTMSMQMKKKNSQSKERFAIFTEIIQKIGSIENDRRGTETARHTAVDQLNSLVRENTGLFDKFHLSLFQKLLAMLSTLITSQANEKGRVGDISEVEHTQQFDVSKLRDEMRRSTDAH